MSRPYRVGGFVQELDTVCFGRIPEQGMHLGADLARMQRSYILRTGALMLALSLLSAIATISVGYISARVAAGVSRDLRLAVFTRVEHFSRAEFDRFSPA